MMFSLHTEIIIDAPPTVIWSVLIDTGNYSNWNPFIRSLKTVRMGSIVLGKEILLQVSSKHTPNYLEYTEGENQKF